MPVTILSGLHGFADGTYQADLELLAEDIAAFGNMSNVTIYNYLALKISELVAILNGNGTVIGAFCNSGAVIANTLACGGN